MPTLHWIGKEKIINHHLEVPYRVLDHRYGFTEKGQQQSPVNCGNKIIHGDNLEALKSLIPQYEGKIKCIYIDPPYNTGNEGWVYNDNVNDPKIHQWLEKTLSARADGRDAPIGMDDLTRHDKWLCMMYPRLQLLHKLLADDGAIFISIDDNEIANLKLIADEIFGKGNFVGQYNWFKSATPPNLSYKIKKNIEYILCYSKKSNTYKFSGVRKDSKSDDPLTKPQNSFKELRFPPGTLNIKAADQLIKKGLYGTAKFPNELLNDLVVEDGKNKNEVVFKNRFIWVQDKLQEELQRGTKININSKSLVLSYKKAVYDKEIPPNFINEESGVDTTENAGRELFKIFNEKIFDYPKPLSLIQYLINFLCDENAIILDSFAGSGTTAHAVLNLNKQDGGNRKFILIEIEDYADTITAERIRRVIKGYGDTEGTGGAFDFYSLGEPLFDEDDEVNEALDVDKLREYIWFTETHTPFPMPRPGTAYLGKYNGTGYYFMYEKGRFTALDDDALAQQLTEKADRYVIYADNSLISESLTAACNIEFKKIPRDISRL